MARDSWKDQPRAPAGQDNGGQWVTVDTNANINTLQSRMFAAQAAGMVRPENVRYQKIERSGRFAAQVRAPSTQAAQNISNYLTTLVPATFSRAPAGPRREPKMSKLTRALLKGRR